MSCSVGFGACSGWIETGGGGGAVDTVNNIAPDGAGNVELGAADIPYVPTFATAATTGNPSTTVGGQLLWSETNMGPARVVWDAATLEAAAPVGAVTPDVHTVDRSWIIPTPLGGAPIPVAVDVKLEVVNPGSLATLAPLRSLITGDVADALLDGEVVSDGVSLLNVNPGGRDFRVTSPAGRPVQNANLALLGNGGGLVEDVFGAAALIPAVLTPAGPTATGIQCDGTLGAVLISGGLSQAPAGGGYKSIDVLATATVTGVFVLDTQTIVTQSPTDYLVSISSSASLPGGGALPNSDVGVRVFNTTTRGPGELFGPLGFGADDHVVSSFGHLNGPRSNWIGDAIYNSAGTPPDALLDHVGQPNVPLIVPWSNADNGGVGGTLRELTAAASLERHSVILGTANLVSVNAGGTYTGGDGNYPATQASTSGAGLDAEFTVTLTGGTITAVVSVDKYGESYVVADTITLLVDGPTETVAAVLDVDNVAWLLRTNGPVDDLTGPVNWRCDFERGVGGAGSTVFGYMARRVGGLGPWVEVPGTSSIPQSLLSSPLEAGGSAVIKTIGVGDEWTIFWLNDNGNSTQTLFTIINPFVEGQP